MDLLRDSLCGLDRIRRLGEKSVENTRPRLVLGDRLVFPAGLSHMKGHRQGKALDSPPGFWVFHPSQFTNRHGQYQVRTQSRSQISPKCCAQPDHQDPPEDSRQERPEGLRRWRCREDPRRRDRSQLRLGQSRQERRHPQERRFPPKVPHGEAHFCREEVIFAQR